MTRVTCIEQMGKNNGDSIQIREIEKKKNAKHINAMVSIHNMSFINHFSRTSAIFYMFLS